MQRLSALDALFLHLETPGMPMHVGSLALCSWSAQRGPFVRVLRDHLAARLAHLPALRRTLVPLPLQFANPVWRDDGEVDLRWHVRSARLRPPGSRALLMSHVAAEHARPMDRTRPLWQFTVIEGLGAEFAEGTIAVYSKLHHALVDGQAAVALAASILEPLAPGGPGAHESGDAGEAAEAGENASTAEAPRNARRSAHGAHAADEAGQGRLPLAGRVLAREWQQARQLARALPAVARAAVAYGRQALRPASDEGATRPQAPLAAPRTFLGGSVSGLRSFATASVPLDRLRAIGRGHGVTVNDLVLWLVSTAMRDYLDAHGARPARSLLASVPVSLRAAGDATSNTQATLTRIALATDIDDPLARLAAIRARTVSMKDAMAAVRALPPIDPPSIGMPWLLRALGSVYETARLAERLPGVVNLVVSNVPGPPVPMRLAGARVLEVYPLSIVVHGVGLNVTVQGYADRLGFGCVACGAAAPDIDRFAAGIERAFDTLESVLPAEVPAAGAPAAQAQAAEVPGVEAAPDRARRRRRPRAEAA